MDHEMVSTSTPAEVRSPRWEAEWNWCDQNMSFLLKTPNSGCLGEKCCTSVWFPMAPSADALSSVGVKLCKGFLGIKLN